jgi:oxygen-independent coproporphyrinogen-3 oxidase
MSPAVAGGTRLAENGAVQGIYVHIPFCARKCGYCDFYSVVAGGEAHEEFVGLLSREAELLARECPEVARAPSDTVYFGGGTPTVLGAGRLVRLLALLRDRFPVSEGAEISVEANPGTVSAEALQRLREGGFTRLSLGVQSFHPATLAALGRIHTVDDARSAYRDARKARFASVGIDLIFGNPGQSEEDWRSDLDRAVTFLPDHVSAYALAPEPGTPVHAAIARGESALPADDEVARMYETIREILAAAGYRHYEISNFSRPGKECRHNLKYWRREGYLGLGPSAHGLFLPGDRAPFGVRTANPPSLAEYAGRLREGRLPRADATTCDRTDAWKEFLIFGLRLGEGVSLAEGEKRYGPPPPELREAVEGLADSGSLLREAGRLLLPERFWFVSNEVLRRLA